MRILLLLTILLLISCENFAQHQKIYRNNVIVVINTDAQSKRFPEIYEHAVDYLNTVLFTGKLNSKSGNHKLIFGGGLEPLVDFRRNDKLTLYTFGVNEPIPELKGKNYLDHFSEKYFKKVAIKDQKDFSDEFKSIVSKNNCRYTAQEYMQSLLMRDVSKQNIYAEKTYILYFNTPQLYFVTRQINLLVPPAKIATFDDLTSVFNNSFQRVNRLRLEMIQPYNQGGAVLQHPMEIRLEEILPGSALSFQMNLLNSSFYSGSTGVELGELQLKINGIGNDIKLEELKLLYGEVAEDYDYSIDNHGFQNVELSLSVLDFTSDPVVLSDLTGTEGNFYLQSELLLRLEPVTANKYDLSVGFIIKSNELGPVQFAPPPSPIPSWVWFIVLAVVIVVIVTYYIKRDLEFETSPNKLTEIPSFEKATYFFEITYKNVGWFKKLINSKLKLQIKSDNFDIGKSGSLLINESEYKKDQVFNVKLKGETKVTFSFTFYDPQKFIDKNITLTIKTKYDVLFFNKDINAANISFIVRKLKLRPSFDYENTTVFDDIDVELPNRDKIAALPKGLQGSIYIPISLVPQNIEFVKNYELNVNLQILSPPKYLTIYNKTNKTTENEQRIEIKNEIAIVFDPKKAPNVDSLPVAVNELNNISISIKNDGYIYESELQLLYFIKPDFGNHWIALDPGTTGSTVVGYDGEKFYYLDDSPDKSIIPSVVVYRNEISPDFGKDALKYLDKPHIAKFMSLKKLIGINKEIERKTIDQNNNDKTFTVKSEKAAKDFINHILSNYHRKNNLNAKFRFKNIILCVPNTFTERKVKAFKEYIPTMIEGIPIKRVRHIYESEAVIVNEVYSKPLKKKNGEIILVCDLGGGTINISSALVHQENNHIKIELLSRIGAAIGGEEITRRIADKIWGSIVEIIPKLKKYDPVNKSTSDHESENQETLIDLKFILFKISEKIKINLSNNSKENSNFEEDAPKLLKDFKQGLTKIIFNLEGKSIDVIDDSEIVIKFSKNELAKILSTDIGNHNSYQKLINNLLVFNLELINEKPVDKLIITGRSSFIMGIKDFIKLIVNKHNNKCNSDKIIIREMTITDSKLAVSRGAAIYAFKPVEFKLTRSKALANYLIAYNKNGEDQFKETIKINTPFVEKDYQNIIEFSGNGFDFNGISTLRLIQSLSNSSVPEQNRTTTISKIDTQYLAGKANIYVKLDNKDIIQWKIESLAGTLEGESNIEVLDLYEYDESNIWHIN